ncbi:hypothetical protein BT96DRAFT_921087 [Gymnopus androsaceus JB14]|uniref:Uncharacterized protein n=1 Tax=Gymnopus androsaceus JB14 TaxID=1447944 RepID=A0A6A4HJ29_9AGAR|nr:hypothetical protein BT96DRAFT_921087 [Gymnopus androsaceus JB14]
MHTSIGPQKSRISIEVSAAISGLNMSIAVCVWVTLGQHIANQSFSEIVIGVRPGARNRSRTNVSRMSRT